MTNSLVRTVLFFENFKNEFFKSKRLIFWVRYFKREREIFENNKFKNLLCPIKYDKNMINVLNFFLEIKSLNKIIN